MLRAVAGFAYQYVFQAPDAAHEVAAGDSPGREAPAEA